MIIELVILRNLDFNELKKSYKFKLKTILNYAYLNPNDKKDYPIGSLRYSNLGNLLAVLS